MSGVDLLPKGSIHTHTDTDTHTHRSKHTDSFAFPMKGFQQVAVIRGRDGERVSEDSQQALRQWGAIWKPHPLVEPLLLYCLPADGRHGGVFNEHSSHAGCLKVGLSIHSFPMTLCITGRLLQRGQSDNGGSSHHRLSLFFRSIHNKVCHVHDAKQCKAMTKHVNTGAMHQEQVTSSSSSRALAENISTKSSYKNACFKHKAVYNNLN